MEYDLEQEKAFDYTGLNIDEIVRHITRFNIYPDKYPDKLRTSSSEIPSDGERFGYI